MLVKMMSKPPGCSSKNSVTLYTCSSYYKDVVSDPVTLLKLSQYPVCCVLQPTYVHRAAA